MSAEPPGIARSLAIALSLVGGLSAHVVVGAEIELVLMTKQPAWAVADVPPDDGDTLVAWWNERGTRARAKSDAEARRRLLEDRYSSSALSGIWSDELTSEAVELNAKTFELIRVQDSSLSVGDIQSALKSRLTNGPAKEEVVAVTVELVLAHDGRSFKAIIRSGRQAIRGHKPRKIVSGVFYSRSLEAFDAWRSGEALTSELRLAAEFAADLAFDRVVVGESNDRVISASAKHSYVSNPKD